MSIEEIAQMPTVYEKNHESIYRSYHILELVKKMLARGDSQETIKEIINHLEYRPAPAPENPPQP